MAPIRISGANAANHSGVIQLVTEVPSPHALSVTLRVDVNVWNGVAGQLIEVSSSLAPQTAFLSSIHRCRRAVR